MNAFNLLELLRVEADTGPQMNAPLLLAAIDEIERLQSEIEEFIQVYG